MEKSWQNSWYDSGKNTKIAGERIRPAESYTRLRLAHSRNDTLFLGFKMIKSINDDILFLFSSDFLSQSLPSIDSFGYFFP